MLTAATNIDDAFIVADEQVAQDAGFVEVAQTDHVLPVFHTLTQS